MTKDARFWGRVDKGDSKSACWVWTGAKDGYGYGRVVRSQFSKKPIKAHRYAFYLHYGRWPEGVCTLACGNKACVRPAHLYDAVRHADRQRPAMNGYLEDWLPRILKRYVKGSRVNGVRAIAEDYGLDIRFVREICR